MSGWVALFVCLLLAMQSYICQDTNTQYPCDDRRMYIPIKWFCDNVEDCEDGSDEEGCEIEYINDNEPSIGDLATSEIQNYCVIDDWHTMCQFEGTSFECESLKLFAGLTPEGREAILDMHNKLRSKVAFGDEPGQPKAANMKKLVWNYELEHLAQRWAEQCDLKGHHDISRDKLDGTKVGQNRAKLSSTDGFDTAEIVEALGNLPGEQWFNEVKNGGFDRRIVRYYRNNWSEYGTSGYSSYTQIVWAETEELGCGFVFMKGTYPFNILLICNYATAGNVEGDMVYQIGRQCSACPHGFNSCDDGLCTRGDELEL